MRSFLLAALLPVLTTVLAGPISAAVPAAAVPVAAVPVAAVPVAAVPVAAVPSTAAPLAAGPVATAPVMVVLDASGSMTNQDAPGSRIDAAKRAVTGMINAIPAGSQVGLLVYGTGTGSSDAEKLAGCRDIRQLIPVGPVDKAAFLAAVRGVTARGYTPMGAALEKAAAALPNAGPASIVLVSDGIDTCAPPSTCDVAKRLKAANRDLVIHTVGFKVDAGARADLSCVAQAAGGTYRDARDGSSLTVVLQGQVDAGLRPYMMAGIPVIGTQTPTGAPALGPGQYSDTLPAGARATRYYSVRLARNETAYLATTVVPPALRGGGTNAKLSVVGQLQDQQGHPCLSTERENDTLLAGKVDPVTTLISGVVGGPKWSKRCPTDAVFVLAVTRDSPSSVPTRSEIIVRVERPVSDPGEPVAAIPPGLPAPVGGRPGSPSAAPASTTLRPSVPAPSATPCRPARPAMTRCTWTGGSVLLIRW